MRAAHAAVLRETDATVRIEVSCFDLRYGGFNEAAVFLALLLGNCRPKILNLWVILADKHDQSDFGNSSYPGIAN